MAERKRRRKHTGLVAAALVLAAVAAVAVWQRNNIAAVLTFLAAGSQEEIEQRLQQNQQTITDAVEKSPEIAVRDVTEEEKQALRDGTLTQEELAGRLVGAQTAQPQEEPPKQETPQETPKQETPTPAEPPEQPAAETSAPVEPKVESAYQEQVSAVVAKAYVLREKFTIALDSMKDEAAAEYTAIPEAERTSGKLTEFAKKYVARATALEKQCDAEMDTIVEELTALVTENNGDLSIVDTMIETYAREKSLKKAWYLTELKERGLTI